MRLTPITSLRESKDPRADAIDLAHLTASTIDSSEIGILGWKDVPLADIIARSAKKFEESIRKDFTTPAISTESTDGVGSAVDRREHLVIRDLDLPQVEPSSPGTGEGRIIAHVEYAFCPPDWFERNRHTPHDPSMPLDPTMTAEKQILFDIFTSRIFEVSEHHMAGKECYMVLALHTLDTHLRQGIASRLVQWIFPYAEATKRPLFLVASPVGTPVYRKNGYQVIEGPEGLIEIPLERWGGSKDSVHRMVAMRKDPT